MRYQRSPSDAGTLEWPQPVSCKCPCCGPGRRSRVRRQPRFTRPRRACLQSCTTRPRGRRRRSRGCTGTGWVGHARRQSAHHTQSRGARGGRRAALVSHNFKQGVNSAILAFYLLIRSFKLSWRVAQLRTPHRARRARAGCGAACSPAVALVDLCPPIEHRLGSTIGSTRRAACSHIVRHGTASAKASPMRPRTLHRVLRAVGGWPI